MIMRHAKSSWKVEGLCDHQRPLNKRGRRDAPRIGGALQRAGWLPDTVLSSDSERTRQTCDLISSVLNPPPVACFRSALYLAGVGCFRQSLSRLSTDVGSVLLLAHNPGCEAAIRWFAGVIEPMKTANVALMRTNAATWADAVEHPGQFALERVIRPRA